MSLSLGLGLGLGMTRNPARKPAPNTRDTLVAAIAELKFVTLAYDGEKLTFAPLVIYDLGGDIYVDGILLEDMTNGARPPARTSLLEADITEAKLSTDSFSIHPKLWPLIGGYQGVQCAVQKDNVPADLA